MQFCQTSFQRAKQKHETLIEKPNRKRWFNGMRLVCPWHIFTLLLSSTQHAIVTIILPHVDIHWTPYFHARHPNLKNMKLLEFQSVEFQVGSFFCFSQQPVEDRSPFGGNLPNWANKQLPVAVPVFHTGINWYWNSEVLCLYVLWCWWLVFHLPTSRSIISGATSHNVDITLTYDLHQILDIFMWYDGMLICTCVCFKWLFLHIVSGP